MSDLSCRCCGSKETEAAAANHRYCNECGAYYLYPEASSSAVCDILINYKKSLPEYDESFDWRVFLLRVFLKGKGTILDVGVRNDKLSLILEKEGYRVETVDTKVVASLKNSYDAVIVWDVLEHCHNPFEFLKDCSKLLPENGLFLIRIRDISSMRNIRKGVENLKRAYLNYPTQKSLTLMIQKILKSYPLFIQMEYYGDDFLVCVGRKGEAIGDVSLRALMIAHPDAYTVLEDAVGPRMRIFKTLLNLRQKGILADLSISPCPQCEYYDIIHLFHHTWGSKFNLQQAMCVKFYGKPLVISTIYMDISETNFALRAIPYIFWIPLEEEREVYLNTLSEGNLKVCGFSQKDEILQAPDTKDIQKTLFTLADHLIGLSLIEIRQIGLTLNIHKPFTIVPNCADPAIFFEADRAHFIKKYGIKDFVVSAGHIEIRKNTIMLLHALRKTPYQIVIIGNYLKNEEYYDLCKQYVPENTLFITQLSQEDLASAFAAARVHVLPSWTEGASLSSIEAAMAGCNIVASNRAGEWEYYQDEGFYCNPASPSSIRDAVESAYRLGDQTRRKRLQERMLNNFTFEKAVMKTIEAYQRTLQETANV